MATRKDIELAERFLKALENELAEISARFNRKPSEIFTENVQWHSSVRALIAHAKQTIPAEPQPGNYSGILNSSTADPLTVKFGEGRIAVNRIEEKSKNLIAVGLVLRDSGTEHEIGSPVPGCSREYNPKNGDIYLRFSNFESLQVVIEELETCKKLFESQAEETNAIACDHHVCALAKPARSFYKIP